MLTIELVRSGAGPVVAGHPWVFAQAIAKRHGPQQPGIETRVLDADGRFLGRGFLSPDSAIAVRLVTREDRPLDRAFFVERIEAALALRRLLGLPSQDTTGYRLINAEGDGLAGLVVDVFGEQLVMQIGTIGLELRKDDLLEVLAQATGARAILRARAKSTEAHEGFSAEAGSVFGAAQPTLSFRERGLAFTLPPSLQKTGYYFDQREQRAQVERFAQDREVLDACSYVGAFSLAAARGGARSVTALDSSEPALEVGRELARANGLSNVTFRRADVREELERLADARSSYDLVVLDPPKLVPSIKHLEKGRRAYRHVNRHALRLVRSGGLLVTCSCSAAMNETDFLRMIAFAAKDAGRDVALLQVMRQGPDHPVPPAFGEGLYLKTAFLSVR